MIEHIHIYHTNDVHSHLADWPKIAAFLRGRQALHDGQGELCLLLDIGDHIDRSNAWTEATAGRANVRLLNEAGYDAVTIGNNEGVTLAHPLLCSLYEEAAFDVVLCNLRNADGSLPDWAVPSVVHRTESGVRVALVGATADYPQFYSQLGWRQLPASEALVEEAEALRARADIVIALSHLGLPADEALLERTDAIDVLLGAHTHHAFHSGSPVGSALMAAAGRYAQFVGEVHLAYDKSARRIVERRAALFPVSELPEADAAPQREREMRDLAFFRQAELLSLPAPLASDWFQESAMSNSFTEALLCFTGGEAAIYNAGVFLGDLPAGPVSAADLHRVLPHPINPCVVSLTGRQLANTRKVLEDRDLPAHPLTGLGFRGQVMGRLLHPGLDFAAGAARINGRPVEPNRIYRIATFDLFTFGYFFPEWKKVPKEYAMPEFIRDVLRAHLQEAGARRK